MFKNDSGRLSGLSFLDSPHCDDRPNNIEVDLLVIHAISLPPNNFDTQDIKDFFLGCLDVGKDKFYREIAHLRVSAHFLIDRNGVTVQFVSHKQRAWHAGVSSFKGRDKVNDFSIGIELVGNNETLFTEVQYEELARLILILQELYPKISKGRVVGHSDIAPSRKTDPGPNFDWKKLELLVG